MERISVDDYRRQSEGELLLSEQLKELNIQKNRICREYSFHPVRKWRFDFAVPAIKLGIEVEGGTWKGGRHSRGKGFEDDCEKYNTAVLLGWRILRFTTEMVEDNTAIETIKKFEGITK